MNEQTAKKLDKLRQQIDEIDKQVIDLLNTRAKAAIEIGKLKNNSGASIYAPHREKQVLERIHKLNKGPLPDKVFKAIYREIMSGCISLEKPVTVAYLGPQGSFSHLAAIKKFGSSVNYTDVAYIREVFVEVAQGHCDLGVVPAENSIGGVIIDTLDAFQDLNVKICAEMLLPIHHNLLANCPMDKIERIYSKPEVFGQCRIWLAEHLPGIDIQPVSSTSRAAERASQEKHSAAIGSKLAAELYNLNIVCKNIEDDPNNSTRFIVISKEPAKQTGNDKTSIMFITAHKAGALADVLDVFRQYKINLTSIDSRPSRKKSWEYYFFIDTEGHYDNENMQQAIAEASKHCLQLTVLGSYPKATEPLDD